MMGPQCKLLFWLLRRGQTEEGQEQKQSGDYMDAGSR